MTEPYFSMKAIENQNPNNSQIFSTLESIWNAFVHPSPFGSSTISQRHSTTLNLDESGNFAFRQQGPVQAIRPGNMATNKGMAIFNNVFFVFKVNQLEKDGVYYKLDSTVPKKKTW